MPELSVIHLAIIVAAAIVGATVGWFLRSQRAHREKAAVSAGWQEQLKAKSTEHDRLADQNKGLMEQINQYQASNKDAKNRAKELSEAVQEAYARRDELQRDIKDIRSNLETSLNKREQLQSDASAKEALTTQLENKEASLKKLRVELQNWQSRVPPLIQNFRQRNEDAERLSAELDASRARIAELEAALEHGQTRIEPVRDPDSLTNGRDASNDSSDHESAFDELQVDQIQAAESSTDVRDHLQSIKGIGPAIEKTLHEMGIFTFQQIADMSEYDINRVAKKLKGFRSRIYREDWIGQARELRDQSTSD